jgi:hypothetical protein
MRYIKSKGTHLKKYMYSKWEDTFPLSSLYTPSIRMVSNEVTVYKVDLDIAASTHFQLSVIYWSKDMTLDSILFNDT